MNYLLLAFLSTLGTWLLTLLGSSTLFFFKRVSDSVLNMMLGFSSGIMIAASFFSLLAPAVEMSARSPWLVVTVGFILGGATVLLSDALLSKIKIEAFSKSNKRCAMLIASITLHNIPEGLVVGVAFGALKGLELTPAALVLPLSVAVGIGLQNFPEGAAVSIPLRREGYSPFKSFFYGQLSGMVEPVFGVLGALLISFFTPLLPYALAFAAGAMIAVVVKELIPEAEGNGGYLASTGAILGFSCMMLLDVALG